MNIIKIEKSNQELKLSLYESNLTLLESDAFEDLSTTNDSCRRREFIFYYVKKTFVVLFFDLSNSSYTYYE